MLIAQAIAKFQEWRHFKAARVTNSTNLINLRQFCMYMHNCDVRLVRIEDVLQWFKIMEDLDYDRNTFISRAISLRKLFEFLSKLPLPVLDPWLIPVPNKIHRIPRVINEDQYRQLLAVIPVKTNDPRHIRNMAIVRLLWDTGARNGELCDLNLDDINFAEKKALVRTEKNKTSRPFRELFWTDETNEALKRWRTKREYLQRKMEFIEPEAFFISAYTNKAGFRFTIKGLGEMLRRYSERAKIPALRVANAHAFRHGKAHTILKRGGNSADVMNILGHASLASGSVYQTMFGKELEERYRNFFGN